MDNAWQHESDNSPPAQARNVGMVFTFVLGFIVAFAGFLFIVFFGVPDMILLWSAICLGWFCGLCGRIVQYWLLERYPQDKNNLLKEIRREVRMFTIMLLWLLAGAVAISWDVIISGIWFALIGWGIIIAWAIYVDRDSIARWFRGRETA